MTEHHEPHAIARTTATIATAYLANNRVDTALLPHLLRDIAGSLQADIFSRPATRRTPPPAPPPAKREATREADIRRTASPFQIGDVVSIPKRSQNANGRGINRDRTGVVTGIGRKGPYVRWEGTKNPQFVLPGRLEIAP